MTKKEIINVFEERKVRTVWDDMEEKWYFSVVDVVAVLTDSVDAQAYCRKFKRRLKRWAMKALQFVTLWNCEGKSAISSERHLDYL